jgi:hypothetical protein
MQRIQNAVGRRYGWVLAAGFTSAATVPVSALEMSDLLAMHLGPVSLRPTVSVSEMYNDNVLYQPSGPGREGDLVTTFGAGLTLSLGHEQPYNPWIEAPRDIASFISLTYDLTYPKYVRFGELDAANHALSLKERWSKHRLTVQGSDSLAFITSLLGAGYGIARNVNRTIMNDNYRVDYNLTQKTRLYLNGAHYGTDYAKGTPLYNDDTLRGTLGFEYQAFSKTALFGEVYYGQSAISSSYPGLFKGPHLTSMGGFLGAYGNFTPHLSGRVKVGLDVGEYSNRIPVPQNPVVEASIIHRFREKTATTLSYSRRTDISVQAAGTVLTSDNFSLRVDQRIGSSGRLSAYLSGSLTTGNYGSSGGYANRKDNWIRVDAGLNYLFKVWMTGRIGYEYEKFSVNYQGLVDYDVNRVTLGLAIGY